VDTAATRWKHNRVVLHGGDNLERRPQDLHLTGTGADLQREGMVHSFHTPYYGDVLYQGTPLLQYGVWVTTREERQ
jgi:UDP-N-acetylglucosamine enolpyruvyl transferase